MSRLKSILIAIYVIIMTIVVSIILSAAQSNNINLDISEFIVFMLGLGGSVACVAILFIILLKDIFRKEIRKEQFLYIICVLSGISIFIIYTYYVIIETGLSLDHSMYSYYNSYQYFLFVTVILQILIEKIFRDVFSGFVIIMSVMVIFALNADYYDESSLSIIYSIISFIGFVGSIIGITLQYVGVSKWIIKKCFGISKWILICIEIIGMILFAFLGLKTILKSSLSIDYHVYYVYVSFQYTMFIMVIGQLGIKWFIHRLSSNSDN